MIPPERQIPFPLESAKGDASKLLGFRTVNQYYVSLLEVGPLTAPGYCEIIVGPGTTSATEVGLTIEEGRLLLHLVTFQLMRGKHPDVALDIARILMMYRVNP